MSNSSFLLAVILLIRSAKFSSLRPVKSTVKASVCLMLKLTRSTFKISAALPELCWRFYYLLIPPAIPCSRLFFLDSFPCCFKDVLIMPPPPIKKSFLCLKEANCRSIPELRIWQRAHKNLLVLASLAMMPERVKCTYAYYQSHTREAP